MDTETAASINYRFSGYQLPMIQLDETGAQYISIPVHPYYYNQPEFWATRPITYDHFSGEGKVITSGPTPASVLAGKNPAATEYHNSIPSTVSPGKSGKLFKML